MPADRLPPDLKKRARSSSKPDSPKANKTKAEAEDEDDAPASKRARRSRLKIEDDEEEEVEEPTSKGQLEQAQKSPTSRGRSPSVEAGSTSKAAKEKKSIKKEDKQEADESEKEAIEEAASDSSSEAEAEAEVVTAKARQKVQSALKTQTQSAYPDWKPGEPVPYGALCKTFSLIEMTTKRLVIMEYCSLFLRQVMRLTPDDLLPTVLLMINKLAPDYAGIELGIGESLIMKAIGETTGRSLAIIKADHKEIGDLGLVAVKSRSTQPTMFKLKPLTVRGVHQGLMEIATVSGNGAQGRKVNGIKKLLSAADGQGGNIDINKDRGGASEAKFIVRFLEGKLRLGLAERTVLVSLAQAIVFHEADVKGQVPSTSDLEKGEAMLKTTYR